MTHVRQQIRDAAATAITGLATTGTNVYTSRIFPTPQSQMPAWNVYSEDEEIEYHALGHAQQRTMELVFMAAARSTTDVDATLDTMLEELETALGSPISLAGAKEIRLSGIETEDSDEGDNPFGAYLVTYQVTYITDEGAPDTAL